MDTSARISILGRRVIDLESQRSAAMLLGDIDRIDKLSAEIDRIKADIDDLKTTQPPPG